VSLVILVPVLRRPHRVAPLLASIFAATPVPHRVVFITDPDDTAEHVAIGVAGGARIDVDAGYAGKIAAGVRATTEPLIFLGADDLHFHPGWFPRALARLRDPISVVGVNDLCSRRVREGRHATHFLMTREYAEQPTIDGQPGPLCQLYDHSFVDDELVATARKRGTIAFARDSIVEHLHPTARKAPMDEVYERGRAEFHDDRAIFESRSHLWT